MIENEFLFLGLLAGGPKHGYDIKRQIEKELVPAISLQIKSIYYPLKKMEDAGLIEKEVGRKGRFPEKYVYRITPKGKKRFDELIGNSFVSVERPFFQIDLSLYFLPLTDQAWAKKRLKARLALLKRIHRELLALKNNLSRTKPLGLILTHNLDLVEAEIASTVKVMTQL
ncbi:MAG: PadR family transcriptional regulator [Candidatus Omnitrophica bacterium]|nr:PadR family transcriptional regulator [Candidatus Omnitrophota bacterium]